MDQPLAFEHGASDRSFPPCVQWTARPPITGCQTFLGIIVWLVIAFQIVVFILLQASQTVYVFPENGECADGYVTLQQCTGRQGQYQELQGFCFAKSLCTQLQECASRSLTLASSSGEHMTVWESFGHAPLAAALMPLGFLYGIGNILLLRAFPRAACWTTLVLTTLAPAALWAWMAAHTPEGQSTDMNLLLLSVAYAVSLALFRKRIETAIAMIGMASDAIISTPSILAVAAAIKIVWLAYAAMYFASLIAAPHTVHIDVVMRETGYEECELLLPYLRLSSWSSTGFLFVTLFFQNCELMATAMGTATWYFGDAEGQPATPALEGAKMAFGPSSGAVAQAALVQAIVDKLQKQADKWCTCNPLTCVMKCLMWFIGETLKALSRFSLIAHAVYGGGLMETSKLTWKIIKDNLGDAVATNNVAATVMSATSTAITLILSFMALWLYGSAIGGNADILGNLLAGTDASSAGWILLGLMFMMVFVQHRPLTFIVAIVVWNAMLLPTMHAAGFNQPPLAAVIQGVVFITAICSVIMNYFGMVVLHAADTVFFCYAVEKHNGKVQERHNALYARLSENITLVQAVVVAQPAPVAAVAV